MCIILYCREPGDELVKSFDGSLDCELASRFESPNSRSGGVREDGIHIISCCCETGDRILKSFDGADCESASRFKSTLEMVGEGVTRIWLISLENSNDSDG
jgi:hypothetical protein